MNTDKLKPIELIARECNGELTTFDNEPLCYSFAIANLEKLREFIIQNFILSLDSNLINPKHFVNPTYFLKGKK